MTNACKKCVHKAVCKHKEQYNKLVVNYNFVIDFPFNFGIFCSYFNTGDNELLSFNWFNPNNLFCKE